MDTDGCVYFCKRDKRVYLKFTNRSLRLLHDFKEGCRGLNLFLVKGGQYNAFLYRKEAVKRFIKAVGFSNEKHLSRYGAVG